MGRRVRWLGERLSLYLPVLLMGLMALATYWLVRSTPGPQASDAPAAQGRGPDYFMRDFSVRTFDAQGRLRAEVAGSEMRHFPDSDRLEIDGVRIRSFDPQGRLTTVTARRALTRGDASELQLLGDAQVLREAQPDETGRLQPSLEFRGNQLHADLNRERVVAHEPVQLVRGADRFTADAMEYDQKGGWMQLTGRVRGTLFPDNGRP
ncbi:MAG: LPS export ABC transporter periplasmic protein LptC [Rhodoferax sp.]|nr:LPS export ABC transporter periplasmic protein LptC [Rhodoferax sp.]